MGLIDLPTLMVDFYGFHIGKYTSPMDPMGFGNEFVNSGSGTTAPRCFRGASFCEH